MREWWATTSTSRTTPLFLRSSERCSINHARSGHGAIGISLIWIAALMRTKQALSLLRWQPWFCYSTCKLRYRTVFRIHHMQYIGVICDVYKCLYWFTNFTIKRRIHIRLMWIAALKPTKQALSLLRWQPWFCYSTCKLRHRTVFHIHHMQYIGVICDVYKCLYWFTNFTINRRIHIRLMWIAALKPTKQALSLLRWQPWFCYSTCKLRHRTVFHIHHMQYIGVICDVYKCLYWFTNFTINRRIHIRLMWIAALKPTKQALSLLRWQPWFCYSTCKLRHRTVFHIHHMQYIGVICDVYKCLYWFTNFTINRRIHIRLMWIAALKPTKQALSLLRWQPWFCYSTCKLRYRTVFHIHHMQYTRSSGVICEVYTFLYYFTNFTIKRRIHICRLFFIGCLF